jgi:SAM-dependent methyltransferase
MLYILRPRKGSASSQRRLGEKSLALHNVIRTVIGLLREIDRRLFPRGQREWDLLREWILPECETVLDVGCGNKGKLPALVPGIRYSLGVDFELPDEGSAEALHSAYRELDVRSISTSFERRAFDCVVALDVVEHLTREDGRHLLDAMECVASKRVIVFTPNGFLPQPGTLENPFQEHLSGWTVDDFVSRGYSVVGVNGWRPLRGAYAAIRWRPAWFWWRLSLLTECFVRARPRHAFQLLCMKEVGETTPARVSY